MADNPTPEEIAAKQHEIEIKNAAQFVKNRKKERQRALASKTLGQLVHDIIEFEDDRGDDVIVWVYREPRGRDIVEGNKAVVMILFLEQNRQGTVFDEVTFKGGRYWTDKNENLVLKIKACEYEY